MEASGTRATPLSKDIQTPRLLLRKTFIYGNVWSGNRTAE